jgi:uncharacterized membrane protein (Fun14 family)
MTDLQESQAHPDADDGPRPPLQTWKKILMGIAGAMVAVGLAMLPFQSGEREDLARTQSLGRGEMLQGPDGQYLPGSGDPEAVGGAAETSLSPALLKMGFSFFAAFAVGLAFRTFLKIALIFVGLQFLALFGLSYVDWVTVNWETMSTAFDRFAAGVQDEAQSFQTFVTGSLPQAGLGMLGLVAGLKR